MTNNNHEIDWGKVPEDIRTRYQGAQYRRKSALLKRCSPDFTKLKCGMCGEYKPFSEYRSWEDRRYRDDKGGVNRRYAHWCNDCAHKYYHKYYQKYYHTHCAGKVGGSEV